MFQGCRRVTLPLPGILYVIMALVVGAFLWHAVSAPAHAFVDLYVDERPIATRPAVHLLSSGLGIAVHVLEPELGMVVDDTDFPVIELSYDGRTALTVVDDKTAIIDGRPRELAAAPVIIDGTLVVPLTLVADLAKLRLDWDLVSGSLTLHSRGKGVSQATIAAGSGPAGQSEPSPSGPSSVGETFAAGDSGQTGGTARNEPSAEAAIAADVAASPGSDKVHESEPLSAETTPRETVAHPLNDEPPGAGSVVADPGSAGPALTDEGVADLSPIVVQDVQIVQENGHIQIEVFTDRDVDPNIVFLPAPSRLVVDIDGAVAATGWQTWPGDGHIVEQVRVNGGDEGSVRIVADLTAPTGYTLQAAQAEPGFVLRLNHQLQLIRASETASGGLALHMHTSGPVSYRVFRLREPERLVVDLFGVTVAGPQELALPGPFATNLRLSQFEQTAVRGVLSLQGDLSGLEEPVEGVLRPGGDGVAQLLFDEGGVTAVAPRPVAVAQNDLQFVGFGRTDDLEYILIRAKEPLDVNVLRLRGPDRIVLDLPGVEVERSLGLSSAGGGVVKAVRAGQADDEAGRIVAETVGALEHHLLLSFDRRRAVLAVRRSGLAGRTIVVDAGHGGRDPGAIGHSGSLEKDVTLSIALQVAQLLGKAGANVVLTRDRDVELTLAERAETANLIGADAFVSIHADAVGFGRIASGTSTFYHTEDGNGPETSTNRRYAETLQAELLKAVGLPDRGVHERAFHVVLNTKMPSALVEVGFIDNPREEQLLLDAAFQSRAAAGIADGISRFFGEQAASASEQLDQWQARTAEETSMWLWLGLLPDGVRSLEPMPLLAVSQVEGRLLPEMDF